MLPDSPKIEHPTDWKELNKSVEGENEPQKAVIDYPISWKEFHDLIESVQRRRSYLERKQEKLSSMYNLLMRENKKFEKEKDLIVEEMRIIKGLIDEYRARYHSDINNGATYIQGLDEITGVVQESLDQAVNSGTEADSIVQTKPTPKIVNIVTTPQQTTKRLLQSKKSVDLQRKKQIKTALHHMLEIVDKRGKLRIKDLSDELGVDSEVVLRWAKVMESRGMLTISYSLRGGQVIERASTAR
ncbi:MAG: hypothetical protein JW778_04730 [Candidatus Altiarchaeota archaeon]|nr:hypothetical protein [Candidatus Altiarchaeota archaeon]